MKAEGLEIWGGIECTLNRVGSDFIDQFKFSGHLHRGDDLEQIAKLGIRKLRYPIHWERVQPLSPARFDWSFPDQQLQKLSSLQIEPIVGLLHHGSGPKWTSLIEKDFPTRLADYALAVAIQYPQVRDYTPVNEPLTTARFSALYGHWFPHLADDRSFAQVLLNQVEGVIRSMQAIRSVRPDARLVQTEDIGKVLSTPVLAAQAAFENERRWLTFDMLTGRFNEKHPLWSFILGTGIPRKQVEFIQENKCAPDLLGINYYVTSERWLDEDISSHSSETHGGNGVTAYADVAAVRGCPEGVIGIAGIVREVWDRYHAPLAITESHLGCTREEQMRWLVEIWRAGERLRREQVDLRAVTAWSLLGAYDWNSLVTRSQGIYEPGAFDVRGPKLRPTALARTIEKIATGASIHHPVLEVPGWWHRWMRSPAVLKSRAAPPLLILGAAGNLARSLHRVCDSRGIACVQLSRYEADLLQPGQLKQAIERYRPWAVVNAAGYTLIDDAESERERCLEVNVLGAFNAASVCGKTGVRYVTISSDLVFDGVQTRPYVESDPTRPLSVYGESKQRAEKAVLRELPTSLVIRTSPLFDRWSAADFTAGVLLQSGMPLVLPEGRISPTYAVDLCHALLDLLIDGEFGIWHLANVGDVSWREFANVIANTFHVPAPHFSLEGTGAPRPIQSILASEKSWIMPGLENAMARFYEDFHPLLQSCEVERAIIAR